MEKELPKNWVETDLDHLFNLVYGKGLSVSELLDEGFDVYGANGIIGKYDKFTYEKSKVVISCRGAASGAIHKTKPQSFITSNSIVLDEVSDELLNLDFVKYAITIADKSDVITGTAQPQITIQLLKYLKFPLPPLAEQNRIVARLNTLFAQLETIKTSMAKVPVLLKDFRQQVLTQAVTGKLTGVKTKVESLGVLLNDVKYGTSKKSDYETEGTPILRIPNINDGEINDGDLKFSILDEKEEKQLRLKKGDILLIRSNGSVSIVGQCAIIRDKHVGYSYAGYLIRLRCNENLISEFLNYSLKSNYLRFQIVEKARSTSGVNNINSQEIKDLEIKWCSPKEQQEIVSRVESLFAKADAIEKQYESVKAKLESLPQAILHKAFKGELTEQLESDGDARKLLEQIQELKSQTVKSKTKVVKKRGEKEVILGVVTEQKEALHSKVIKLKPTNVEIYKRTLLAAEIVYQLKETNTLGHLKLQKMLYLSQEIGSMNLPMNFLKQAMGPYDNQLARSLDKQFIEKKWFEYRRDEILKYKPLQNCGKHKEDFQKYFETELEQINYLITKFKVFTSNQIEAVATLYACWKEAIGNKELITDKLIITKFYQWSKEKEKFREENLVKALEWMRKNGVEPK